jgi:hypothetical protein
MNMMIAPTRLATESTVRGAECGRDLEYARKEIQNVLQDHPEGRPLIEAIQELSTQLDVPILSGVLTELISQDVIELTSDRRLRWIGPDHSDQ